MIPKATTITFEYVIPNLPDILSLKRSHATAYLRIGGDSPDLLGEILIDDVGETVAAESF